MGSIEGYVTVFESSDGAAGKNGATFWQFFVAAGGNKEAVTTRNARLADTMRLAVETSSRVRVSYDDTSKVMTQARIEFRYICEELKVDPCGPGEVRPSIICVTRRYSECRPEQVPRD